MPCYRVPIRYHRREQGGHIVVIERNGMVVSAQDESEAETKAAAIAADFLDFAGIGAAVFLHPFSRHTEPVAAFRLDHEFPHLREML